MTINQRVFDTAIDDSSSCSKAIGMTGANHATQNFFIDTNGDLIVTDLKNFAKAYIRKSTDNGFQWSQEYINFIGARADSPNGPCVANFVTENTTDDGYVFAYVYNNRIWWIYTDTSTLDTLYGEVTIKYGLYQDSILDNFIAATGDGKSLIYAAYLDGNNDLNIIGFDVYRSFSDALQDYVYYGTENFKRGTFSVKGYKDKVHIIAADSNDVLGYLPFYKKQGNGDGHFSGFYPIVSGAAPGGDTSFVDVGIDIDSDNNLCAIYGVRDANPGTELSGFYAISNDDGNTWQSVYNPPPSGYTFYTDATSTKVITGGDLLGGYSGSFLLSQLFMKDNSGTLFVKEVSSTNVPSGTSTDEWLRVNSVDGNVLGGKFFKYTNEAIPNFGDKSAIRMAYQVGSGNNLYGQDSLTSTIYHERLSNNAYPLQYSGSSVYSDNYDYYASGLYNETSQLYIDKIDELGMSYSFSKYDPEEESEITGRGSYQDPTTIEFTACIDPGAYAFANVARNNSDFTDYIERDTRKIFYKPNQYLDRTFVLNRGGFLKRTIWTVRFMGNDYEIAQIVPRFLNGYIIYYEANLYVIGPSNDPFTKVILPSET